MNKRLGGCGWEVWVFAQALIMTDIGKSGDHPQKSLPDTKTSISESTKFDNSFRLELNENATKPPPPLSHENKAQ